MTPPCRDDSGVIYTQGTSSDSAEIRYGVDTWASLIRMKISCFLCNKNDDGVVLHSLHCCALWFVRESSWLLRVTSQPAFAFVCMSITDGKKCPSRTCYDEDPATGARRVVFRHACVLCVR